MSRAEKMGTSVLMWAAMVVLLFGGAAAGEPRDAEGNQRAMQSAYDFDDAGRLIAAHLPDGRVLQFEYGAPDPLGTHGAPLSGSSGRLLSVSVSRYNEQGGLEPLATPEGRTQFQYDKNGNCIQASNKLGKTEYFYDPLNRLTKVTYDYPGLKKSVSYDYDPHGRIGRTAVASPTGAVEFHVGYDYDALGRIIQKDVNGLKIRYAYDPVGSQLTRELPNGLRTVYQTGPAGVIQRAETFAGPERISSFEYTYNANQRLTQEIAKVGGKSWETRFEYNQLGQLTGMTRSDGTRIAIEYDATGALKQLQTPQGLIGIQRNPLGLVERFGDTRLTLDAAGRPTALRIGSEAHQIAYDSFGRLAQWSTPNGSWTHDYSAEGFHLGSRLGQQKWITVPDPLSPIGNPLFVSGPNVLDVKADMDLSVRFAGPAPQVTLEDPFGNPLARGVLTPSRWDLQTLEIPKPDLSRLLPLESPWKQLRTAGPPQMPFQQLEGLTRGFVPEKRLDAGVLSHSLAHWGLWQDISNSPADTGRGPTRSDWWTRLALGDVSTPGQFMDRLCNLERSWLSWGTGAQKYLFGEPTPWLEGLYRGVMVGQDVTGFQNDSREVGIRLLEHGVFGKTSEWAANKYVVKPFIQEVAQSLLPNRWAGLLGALSGEAVGLSYDLARGRGLGSWEASEHILDSVFGAYVYVVFLVSGGGPLAASAAAEFATKVPDFPREVTRPLFEQAARWWATTGSQVAADWIWQAGIAAGNGALDQFNAGMGRRPLVDTMRWFGSMVPWLRDSYAQFDNAAKRNDTAKMIDMLRHNGDIRRVLRANGWDADQLANHIAREPQARVPYPDGTQQKLSAADTVGAPSLARNLLGMALAGVGEIDFQPKGVKFDKPAEFVGQIGAIRGVSFDPATKRLVLLGDGNPMLPPVRLDDFVTAILVVYGSHEGEPNDPTFSLDPMDPANPAGDWLQPVYRPGLLEGRRMGRLMLQGDWLVKQYAFGVIADYDGNIIGKRISSVSGYRSYLELLRANPSVLAQGPVCTRFWIVPGEMKLEKQGNTLVFSRATMRLEARRMDFGEGGLHDSQDKSDPVGEQFAAWFTLHYDQLAREAPVLEELREAAKVVAIVKWLQKQGVGVNDFSVDFKAAGAAEGNQQAGADPKRIRSLRVSEALSMWGLGRAVVQIVGGVELAPRPVTVPASTSSPLDGVLSPRLAGPSAAAVGQVVMDIGPESSRYFFSTIPITNASREFLAQHPVYVDRGVVYAHDQQGRLVSVLDRSGDSLVCTYGSDNRLVRVGFRDAFGWQVQGELATTGNRDLRVRSPNGEEIVYRFAQDGKLTEALVNGQSVVRVTWQKNDQNHRSAKIEYLQPARPFAQIGELAGDGRTQSVVLSEQVEWKPEELRYKLTRPGRPPESYSCKLTDSSLVFEGTGLAPIRLTAKDPATLVEEGPLGKTEYRFHSKTGLLERVSRSENDYVMFPEGQTQADGSEVILRAKRGGAEAEATVSKDGRQWRLRDFDGNLITWEYDNGRLMRIQSPQGQVRFDYHSDDRLAAVYLPDGRVQRFVWQQGLGVMRLYTRWEHGAAR